MLRAPRQAEKRSYLARPSRTARCGRDVYLLPAGSQSATVIDSGLASVLMQLSGSRTLEQHLAVLGEKFPRGVGGEPFHNALKELISLGLLIPEEDFLRSVTSVDENSRRDLPSNPPSITAVGIIAAGDTYAASLESFIEHGSVNGKPLSIVICDDRGTGAAARAKERPSDENRIEYFGLAERRRFAEAILEESRGSFDQSILAFALFGDERFTFRAGANRNAFLLSRIGEAVVMSDDDEGCEYALARDPAEGVCLDSRANAAKLLPFPGDQDAFDSASERRFDLPAAHEVVLGRSIAGCLGSSLLAEEAVDLEHAWPRLIDSVARLSPKVVATTAGVLGDSGMGYPRELLFLEDEARELMLRSEDVYRRSIESRSVCWATNRPVITDAPFFRTGHCGCDTRELLPPFAPVGRLESGFFGELLTRCYPPGCIAHIPAAVLHKPSVRRSFTREDVRRVELRSNDLLTLLLYMLPQSPIFPLSPEAALRSAGAHLSALGSCKKQVFSDAVHDLWLKKAAAEIERAEAALALYGSTPYYWAEDVRHLIETYEASIRSGLPPFMVDIAAKQDAEHMLSIAQGYVKRHGELLSVWPDIYEAARRVRYSDNISAPSNGE